MLLSRGRCLILFYTYKITYLAGKANTLASLILQLAGTVRFLRGSSYRGIGPSGPLSSLCRRWCSLGKSKSKPAQ
jgi:hypothetical protein